MNTWLVASIRCLVLLLACSSWLLRSMSLMIPLASPSTLFLFHLCSTASWLISSKLIHISMPTNQIWFNINMMMVNAMLSPRHSYAWLLALSVVDPITFEEILLLKHIKGIRCSSIHWKSHIIIVVSNLWNLTFFQDRVSIPVFFFPQSIPCRGVDPTNLSAELFNLGSPVTLGSAQSLRSKVFDWTFGVSIPAFYICYYILLCIALAWWILLFKHYFIIMGLSSWHWSFTRGAWDHGRSLTRDSILDLEISLFLLF